jgi:hypothetical protein|eukprot:COSAG01_NODE_25801_length_728_cov_4.022117_1_plen_78_part_00
MGTYVDDPGAVVPYHTAPIAPIAGVGSSDMAHEPDGGGGGPAAGPHVPSTAWLAHTVQAPPAPHVMTAPAGEATDGG